MCITSFIQHVPSPNITQIQTQKFNLNEVDNVNGIKIASWPCLREGIVFPCLLFVLLFPMGRVNVILFIQGGFVFCLSKGHYFEN